MIRGISIETWTPKNFWIHYTSHGT